MNRGTEPKSSPPSAGESTAPPVVEDLVRAVLRRRFRYSTERELQDGLAAGFQEEGIPFSREENLGAPGRPDFWVPPGVAVEVKIKGSPTSVVRQVCGYASSPRVLAIVVVTGRVAATPFPPSVMGKPVRVVPLWRSAL